MRICTEMYQEYLSGDRKKAKDYPNTHLKI